MLLGDADIEAALGEALGELVEAGARGHGRGDGDDLLVGLGLGDQRLGEHRLVGRRIGHRLGLLAGDDVELHHAVVLVGAVLGRRIALALLGDDMDQDRLVEPAVARVLQHRQQMVEIVPVDRTDIVEAELVEQRAAGHEAARELLGAPRRHLERLGQRLGDGAAEIAQADVGPARQQAREMRRHGADRRGDRHVVVVQHHDQPAAQRAGIVHRLVGHAGAHGAVADHRHDMVVAAGEVARHRHAQAGRDRGRGMGGAERVVLALAAPREARQAVFLAQGADAAAPAGDDLVRIGLVADVPDQPVARRVEHVVQRHRELDHAQPGAEMAAGDRDGRDRLLAQLVGELAQLVGLQPTDVGRYVDGIEKRRRGRS